MNEENLKPNSERTPSEIKEMTTKGGINSGKSRRKKADMRKAVQSMLDNTYSDNSGKELSGAEIMALKLFKIATNETEIKLLETKIKALSGLDDGETKKLLDNINKILNDVDSVIE